MNILVLLLKPHLHYWELFWFVGSSFCVNNLTCQLIRHCRWVVRRQDLQATFVGNIVEVAM